MCCGNLPAAPESADLIAIIHPTKRRQTNIRSHSRSTSGLGGRLRLSNSHTATTTTEFQSQQTTSTKIPGTLNVQIHRFGQPLSEHEDDGFSGFHNPVMHSFQMDVLGARSLTGLRQRLDLGVGGEGVIGRTVSIVDGEGGLLGQGIIGRI